MRYKELTTKMLWNAKATGKMTTHVRSLSRALVGTLF